MLDERLHSMPDDRLPAAVTDGECCDLARKIRELAGQTGLMFAQRELLLLTEKFERRSDYPDPEEAGVAIPYSHHSLKRVGGNATVPGR
jgi:hypothetical protein